MTATTSPLFSETPVVDAPSAPVVVVGLPRSGSSFLAHLLSQLPDWYVYDDLYILREARALGVRDREPMNREQLAGLVAFLARRLKAALRRRKYAPPEMTIEDVDRMAATVEAALAEVEPTWAVLLEEWLTRLARHQGRSRWGYKTPQDFAHVDLLEELFPGARYVFLYRDPRRVMASKKFVRRGDGKVGQYHPWAYATYWRLASDSVEAVEERLGERLLCLSFEELTRDPQAAAARIAAFLGTSAPASLEVGEPNSSFSSGERKTITPTETWLCERVAGRAMRLRGYETGTGKLRLRDLPNLLATSVRFLFHQAGRLRVKKSARYSVAMFLRLVFGRRDAQPTR